MSYSCSISYSNECTGSTNVMCFCCGQRICKGCSSIFPYGKYGAKRLCFDCRDEDERFRKEDEEKAKRKLVPTPRPKVFVPFVNPKWEYCNKCGENFSLGYYETKAPGSLVRVSELGRALSVVFRRLHKCPKRNDATSV